jgi:hypothetical protein
MNVACLPFFEPQKSLSGSPAGTIERAAKQQRHFKKPESGGLFPARVGAVHPPVHYRQRQSGRMSFATFCRENRRATLGAPTLYGFL